MEFKLPDLDKVRMGIDNQRLSALLCAILDACGPIRLTKEQAEATHEGATLEYKRYPDGGIRITLVPKPSESSPIR